MDRRRSSSRSISRRALPSVPNEAAAISERFQAVASAAAAAGVLGVPQSPLPLRSRSVSQSPQRHPATHASPARSVDGFAIPQGRGSGGGGLHRSGVPQSPLSRNPHSAAAASPSTPSRGFAPSQLASSSVVHTPPVRPRSQSLFDDGGSTVAASAAYTHTPRPAAADAFASPVRRDHEGFAVPQGRGSGGGALRRPVSGSFGLNGRSASLSASPSPQSHVYSSPISRRPMPMSGASTSAAAFGGMSSPPSARGTLPSGSPAHIVSMVARFHDVLRSTPQPRLHHAYSTLGTPPTTPLRVPPVNRLDFSSYPAPSSSSAAASARPIEPLSASGSRSHSSHSYRPLSSAPMPADTVVFADWWLEYHEPLLKFRLPTSAGGPPAFRDGHLPAEGSSITEEELETFVPWVVLKGCSVTGFFEDGEPQRTTIVSHSSAVCTRHSPNEVSTISGRRYRLHGGPNVAKMKAANAGWSGEVRAGWLEAGGFPEDWKELLYRDTVDKLQQQRRQRQQQMLLAQEEQERIMRAQAPPLTASSSKSSSKRNKPDVSSRSSSTKAKKSSSKRPRSPSSTPPQRRSSRRHRRSRSRSSSRSRSHSRSRSSSRSRTPPPRSTKRRKRSSQHSRSRSRSRSDSRDRGHGSSSRRYSARTKEREKKARAAEAEAEAQEKARRKEKRRRVAEAEAEAEELAADRLRSHSILRSHSLLRSPSMLPNLARSSLASLFAPIAVPSPSIGPLSSLSSLSSTMMLAPASTTYAPPSSVRGRSKSMAPLTQRAPIPKSPRRKSLTASARKQRASSSSSSERYDDYDDDNGLAPMDIDDPFDVLASAASLAASFSAPFASVPAKVAKPAPRSASRAPSRVRARAPAIPVSSLPQSLVPTAIVAHQELSRSGRKVQAVVPFWSVGGKDKDDTAASTRAFSTTPIKIKPPPQPEKKKQKSSKKALAATPAAASVATAASSIESSANAPPARKPILVTLSASKPRQKSTAAAAPSSPAGPMKWSQNELTELLSLHSLHDAASPNFWKRVATDLDRPGKDAAECARRYTEHFAPTPVKRAVGKSAKKSTKKDRSPNDDEEEEDASPSATNEPRPAARRAPKPSLRELFEQSAAAVAASSSAAGDDGGDDGDDLFDGPQFAGVRELESQMQAAKSQDLAAADEEEEDEENASPSSRTRHRRSASATSSSKASKKAPAKSKSKKKLTPAQAAHDLQRALVLSLRTSSAGPVGGEDGSDVEILEPVDSAAALLQQPLDRSKTDAYVRSFQRSTRNGAPAPRAKKPSAAAAARKVPLMKASGGSSALGRQITRELRATDDERTRARERREDEDEADEELEGKRDHYFEQDE